MTTTDPLALLISAVAFAAHKHRSQTRKGEEASPYITHPIGLANVLANEGGVRDVTALCAAVLHDTVEDTDTSEAELIVRFGPVIAGVVMEVTDDKSLAREERKARQVEHAARLSPAAKLVKLADKICNLRDMVSAPPMGWSLERKREYFDWSARVVAGIRGIHQELEAVFDQVHAEAATLTQTRPGPCIP
jgi:guanosine-3',5'-bis(diphosphate) 3'-pyrophosphohydrolase